MENVSPTDGIARYHGNDRFGASAHLDLRERRDRQSERRKE
jgi:hypothetical protein